LRAFCCRVLRREIEEVMGSWEKRMDAEEI
jgi:hypothetical protein